MTKFGEELRRLRQLSTDPSDPIKQLTQQRLGELIQIELGVGFSGAAISDWERSVSKIHADQRWVLVSLIKIFHQQGGVKTLAEANHLLELGNYRTLNIDETQKVFGKSFVQQPLSGSRNRVIDILARNIFFLSDSELDLLYAREANGPIPAWPRVLATLLRKRIDNWSISLRDIIWIWLWLVTWWAISPSLRWPFDDRNAALVAITLYAGGTLAIPLVIGLLINTRDNEFWQKQNSADPILLRLYTYQGAAIGFNLGYFFVFPLNLVRYYLHFGQSVWLEWAAVTLALVLGNMSARVTPHNLWIAYGRLKLSDGAILFTVALLGPIWGWMFLQFYMILLAPILGTLLILLSVTILVLITALQSRDRAP